MGSSLIMTSLGGFYLSFFPSFDLLQFLYAFWGFSTTFLFWSAMIKATRNWGGDNKQGKAFGFLEGGRGLVAASIGGIGIFIFSTLMPADIVEISFIEKKSAFQWVIISTSIIVFLVGLLVLMFLEELKQSEKENRVDTVVNNSFKTIIKVSRYPTVWMLIIIVLCAYCGYKVTDILSLYAAEIMFFDEVNAARVGSFQMYLRPIVCIIIGYAADKSSNSKWLLRGFITLFFGSMFFASGIIKAP